MLQEAVGKPNMIQPPLAFSKSDSVSLGFTGKSATGLDGLASSSMSEMAAIGKQPDTKQEPLVFSKSETIPLGLTNKILRKASWGLGALSFVLTGASGILNKTPLRTISGLGSAGLTFFSLFMKERSDPLPDTSIPGQMLNAYAHPTQNTLFFNRASTFITDILKLGAGLQSGRKDEIREGLLKVVIKTIDIAGTSNQDKREKLALKAQTNGEPKAQKNLGGAFKDWIYALSHSRWTSLTASAIAAVFQIRQGVTNNDKNMRASGIMYVAAVACLAVDNAIIEAKIKQANADRGRS